MHSRRAFLAAAFAPPIAAHAQQAYPARAMLAPGSVSIEVPDSMKRAKQRAARLQVPASALESLLAEDSHRGVVMRQVDHAV